MTATRLVRSRWPSVLRPGRRSAGSLLALVAGATAGYLLVAQLRGTESFTQKLASDSQGDLVQILAGLNTEAGNLRDEIDSLKVQLLGLQTSSQQDAAAAQQARQRLSDLEVLAGTVAVVGPGVTVSVTDPRHQVGYDTMVSVVEELRDAGAEAIAVDGHRVGAASWFGQDGTRITLDGAVLTEPYRVTAIGDAATMQSGLQIPGGAMDALQALPDVTAGIERSASLTLPPLSHPPSFRAAHPVGSGP
ncbi:MAG TPA: DUF881 domain-containing protein [Acidimicrobiales bacterium]|nr:DUF881 domain-containing protein [Acidimicrobiales bacterium]